MDYSKMTKAELLREVERQQTLSSVVDNKNKQISQLQGEVAELKNKLSEQIKEARDLGNNAKQLQNENNAMHTTVERLTGQMNEMQEQLRKEKYEDDLVKQNEFLTSEAERVVKLANMYITSFRNYLKLQQGALDNMNEMELMLQEKLK